MMMEDIGQLLTQGHLEPAASIADEAEISWLSLAISAKRIAGALVAIAAGQTVVKGSTDPILPPLDPANQPSDLLRRRLLEARRGAGLRQADLADRLGRPQSFVSNYERGERRLEVSEFITIARHLDLDAAAVITEMAKGA